jgi:hypothetical protein
MSRRYSETCPKCGNFRGHTVRCYEQTEKDRVFRNDVLEAAAQLCEREAKRWGNEGPVPFRVALNCAADIRALKVSAPEKVAVQP